MKRSYLLLLTIVMVSTILASAQPRPPPSYTPPSTKPPYARGPSPMQVTILSEGFEGSWPPTGWNVYDLDGAGETWTYDTTVYHTGSRSALHYYGPIGNMENGWLVTPRIDLTGYTSAELTFWSFGTDISWHYYWGIWITTDPDPDPTVSTYVELQEITPTSSGVWEQFTIDLSAYAGQQIYLAFVYQGDWADIWNVDDVEVLGTPLQVSEFPVWPNITFVAVAAVVPVVMLAIAYKKREL